MAESLNTIEEASKKTKMSVSWWRQKISAREIRFVRLGRRVFIPEDTIQKILHEGMVEPK